MCLVIRLANLRISSLQCGLSSPTESRFTPRSPRWSRLRSSSLRQEDWQLRTEDRAPQLWQSRSQPLSLKKNKANTLKISFDQCSLTESSFLHSSFKFSFYHVLFMSYYTSLNLHNSEVTYEHNVRSWQREKVEEQHSVITISEVPWMQLPPPVHFPHSTIFINLLTIDCTVWKPLL